jgi:hypothetical protein
VSTEVSPVAYANNEKKPYGIHVVFVRFNAGKGGRAGLDPSEQASLPRDKKLVNRLNTYSLNPGLRDQTLAGSLSPS